MKTIYNSFLEVSLIYIFFLFIKIELINTFDSSSLEINFFNIKKLFYVNAMINDAGDLYIEYWGEENNVRYFLGINGTTGKDLYFQEQKVLEIEASQSSIYHESIIINYNNEDNIFSMNFQNFDFINIREQIFSSESTDNLVEERKGDSSFRNSIIKLKDNNSYLLSLNLKISGFLGIKKNVLYYKILTFNSNNINGYLELNEKQVDINYMNSTTCFQTEKGNIVCSYIPVVPSDGFGIVLCSSNLEYELSSGETIGYIENYSFNKIFHITGEIGAFVYFRKSGNVPIVQIKQINNQGYLEDIFSSTKNYEFVINGKGKYSLNNGLFYSDGCKINDSQFVIILTSSDLKCFIICLFSLFYDDKYFIIRYYELDLNAINAKLDVNIRAFQFRNCFGITFYNSNTEYPGYTIFNYPYIIDENNEIKNAIDEITLFIGSLSYTYEFPKINKSNNIFGVNIYKYKIINFPNKITTGVIIESLLLNSEVSIDDEVDINDK